jgi:type I restriction enzyme S subunit
MSSTRYPAYKDSGVAWLGQVPAHWEVKRVNMLGKLLKGSGGTKEDINTEGIPCIRYGELYGKYSFVIETPINFIAQEMYPVYTPLQYGDVVFAASGEKVNEIGKSAVYLGQEPAACGGDTVIFRANTDTFYARFLGYTCDSTFSQQQKSSMYRGTTIKHIYPDELKNLVIPLPPLAEQQAIAAFLDGECARIDALVAAQQRMIALLKEKRQALISQAVTRGLDPAVPLRDSGVAWLGQVPAHWEVKKAKYVCSIQTGDKDTVNALEDGEFPFYVRSENIERINSYTFDGEAVLTAGDGAGVGKVFHYHRKGPLDFHQRVYMMANFVRVTGIYFYYFFSNNFSKVALEGGAKSTVDSLRRPMLADFFVCLPPLAEQQVIAAFLDGECARIDALIGKAEQAIVLLHERRSAVIAAAVTGQIRVG